jgi:two-component system, cell cycle sensor histidine kinase and response regulator CckA
MGRGDVATERLRAAVDGWGIGVGEWHHADGYITGSARFFELYGWSGRDAVPVAAFWAALHAADRDAARAAFERALGPAGSGEIDLIHRVVHGAGKVLWLHLRAQTTFEGRGPSRRPRVTSGSIMDVTERERAEHELRRTRARFDEAVRSAQFGIFEHNHLEDPLAENVYWSPRLREIFGVGEDEPGSAAALLSRIPEEDIERLHQAVRRAHDPAGDGFYDVEHRYQHPTLGMRWLLTRSSTYFAEADGRRIPVRTVGAMIDVTARRKSEQEHEQRAQILDATIDFVAICQPDGALAYLNRAARQFLGMAPHEELAALGGLGPEPLLEMLRSAAPTASRDGAWQGEIELRRHDGRLVPMSLVLLAHRNADGRPLFFSMIARDVSRERQLEENMRQAQKMEAVGRLAGGIAHDFNNILSAILSFAHVAAAEVGEDRAGYAELQEIIIAGKRAAELTQQLLTFSRKQVLRPQVVDVAEVLTRMGPLLRRLVGEHIELCSNVERSPLRVKVDPSNLEQVLLNLAINARDAMEGGGRLGIECKSVLIGDPPPEGCINLRPGEYVLISVSDSGVGMDAETQAHVFEPFFTTKGSGRGTGLGLATVFGILKQSGGSVLVESALGRGSTFRAYFPRTSETPSTIGREPPRRVSGRGGGVVLVVEDDPAVRHVATTVLDRAGYTTLSAPGPVEALDAARARSAPIDLLLTDVVMPRYSGRELAVQLSALHPRLAIIYMSGYTDKDIVHRGMLEEGVFFLPKPLTPDGLLEAVARVLGRGPLAATSWDSAVRWAPVVTQRA